jgi:hypothetical protein
MINQKIKPSRWYYCLSVLVFLVGCVLFAWFLFKNLNGLIDNLTRVIIPGKTEITLSEPGTYTIFYEYESVVGNKVYSTAEALSGLECEIVSKTKGSQIPISRSSKDLEYSFGGRKGIAILEFIIEKQGAYEFAGWYPEGQPRIVLAMGRGFMDKLVGTIVVGMAIFLASAVIGVAVALRIFFKRQEALKKG